MNNFKKFAFVLALIFGLFPALASAEIELLSRDDGAELTSPPTFSWESELNFFFFVSLFTYGDEEVQHPFFFARPFRQSLTMPERWWDRLSYDVAQQWLIIGFESPRQAVWSESRTFTKVAE